MSAMAVTPPNTPRPIGSTDIFVPGSSTASGAALAAANVAEEAWSSASEGDADADAVVAACEEAAGVAAGLLTWTITSAAEEVVAGTETDAALLAATEVVPLETIGLAAQIRAECS